MKSLSSSFNIDKYTKKEKSLPKSERAEVVGLFLERLNKEREGTLYPPLKASRIAMMLAPIKSVKDLRAFYGECLNASNFSKYYWWRFKG